MLHFTEQGLLTPVEGVFTTLEEIRDVFVQPFDGSETRDWLFRNWMKYNQMLRQELGEGFLQWVDGSFVTQKLNPKDVDIVSFIPSYLFRKFEKRLDYYWSDNWEREGIDGYLVEHHADHSVHFGMYRTQLENWRKLYTKTKLTDNPAGASKGFLLVNIE